jgi:hypothetical protein
MASASSPKSRRSRSTSQRGWDVRTAVASGSSPVGQGQAGPRSATRRRTALAYGAARRIDAGLGQAVRAPTVALTAAWGAVPLMSW